ncbi:MAG: hypothetical protein MJZ99_03215 [Bacteroidales bacterium]|nr:hypothetical protein [Bacteroidales bacterium]
MRRIGLLLAAACMTLAACNKEQGEVVFEASFANSNAKISMDGTGVLAWENGDSVRISDLSSGTVFVVARDNASSTAHLHQKLETDNTHTYRNSQYFYALYPGTDRNSNNYVSSSNSSNNIHFLVNAISDVQLVNNDRHYDKAWLTCTASSRGLSTSGTGNRTVRLQFHNCMSLLKCTIDQGCTNIYQLKVTADKSGARIGGAAWVSANDAGVDLTTINRISDSLKKYAVTLKHSADSALEPGDYYIAIWSDFYNSLSVNTTHPSLDSTGYTYKTVKKNVTITPCDNNGQAIASYGQYVVASYSFFRNTVYNVGTFPKPATTKEYSIFR